MQGKILPFMNIEFIHVRLYGYFTTLSKLTQDRLISRSENTRPGLFAGLGTFICNIICEQALPRFVKDY